MKRTHKVTLAGEELTLSLSFGTSLEILEKVESPTAILQAAVASMQGKPAAFRLTEKNIPTILMIGNKEHEGLSYKKIGELCFEHGFINAAGEALSYINAMVSNSSEEIVAEGKAEGN